MSAERRSMLLMAVIVGCCCLSSSQCYAFQISGRPLLTTTSSSRPLSTKLFLAQKMTPTRKTRREDSFDRDDSEKDGSQEKPEDIIFDYSEAQSKMKEEENKRRVEEGLTVGLSQEVRFHIVMIYIMIGKIQKMWWSLMIIMPLVRQNDNFCVHITSLH